MARETKVGLLAGLAFIICFAIILANRGRQDPIVRSAPTQADRSVSTPKIGQGIPIQAQTHPTTPPLPGATLTTQIKRPGARLIPVRKNPVTPTTQGRVDVPHRAHARTVLQRPSMSSGSTLGADDLTEITTPTGNPGWIAPSTKQLQRQAILQQRLDSMDHQVVQKPDTHRRVARTPREKNTSIKQRPTTHPQPSKSLRRYRIKPGDTLTRIAQQHYGRSTEAVIKAIYQANRTKLESPDSLRVDAELVLPEIEGATPKSIVGGGKRIASRNASKPSSSKSPAAGFKWYQIKKNDRYVSIARDQLGDGHRWREIYELNKDKFPDPQRIRHGVRIKLPTMNASVSGR